MEITVDGSIVGGARASSPVAVYIVFQGVRDGKKSYRLGRDALNRKTVRPIPAPLSLRVKSVMNFRVKIRQTRQVDKCVTQIVLNQSSTPTGLYVCMSQIQREG